MNWLYALVIAAICAAAGLLIAGSIALLCIDWYQISGFEGGSGYFAAFTALGGLAVGGLTGLVAGWIILHGGGGFAKGVGVPIAILVGVGLIALGLCAWFGDIAPTIDGERLIVSVELRAPAGWKPSNRTRNGENYVHLESISYSDVRRGYSSGVLRWKDARMEGERLLIPGEVSLYTTTGKRGLRFLLGAEEQGFLAPIPSRPGKEFEQWSHWYPQVAEDNPVAGGFRYRFRVLRSSTASEEESNRRQAQEDARNREFLTLTSTSPLSSWLTFLEDPEDGSTPMANRRAAIRKEVGGRMPELAGLLQAPDSESVHRGLLGVMVLLTGEQSYTLPPAFDRPLRDALVRLIADLRELARKSDPADPDILGGNQFNDRYWLWHCAWRNLPADRKRAVPPELRELRDEAAGLKDLDSMQTVLRRIDNALEKWPKDEAEEY